MHKLITISIPTFNRAKRLDKSLNDLLSQINKSGNQQYLSVFVSNNGSTDATSEIINKYRDIFEQNKIEFSSYSFNTNQGFDANVLNCYRHANSEFIWFLSDDDNIIDNSINLIIDDINKYAPHVLYYNFDQVPYTLNNPFIKTTSLFKCVAKNNVESISKIIAWPKLTALVIKINSGHSGEKVKNLEHGFMHIAIAIQTGLDYGMILHSESCIAHPDIDYMDHIDFPPYIANSLAKTVSVIMSQNNIPEIYQHIKIKTTDPLTSSINVLSDYYMGKCVLTPELKDTLCTTVAAELRNLKFHKIKKELLKSISILLIHYSYNICHWALTGKSTTKLRTL